jgi:hypothetical protein
MGGLASLFLVCLPWAKVATHRAVTTDNYFVSVRRDRS